MTRPRDKTSLLMFFLLKVIVMMFKLDLALLFLTQSSLGALGPQHGAHMHRALLLQEVTRAKSVTTWWKLARHC